MSFDDEESFKEAVESLRFNSSDPNTRQQLESSNSMPHWQTIPHLNSLRLIGCSSIGRSQERSEDHANDTEKYLFPTTSSNFLS